MVCPRTLPCGRHACNNVISIKVNNAAVRQPGQSNSSVPHAIACQAFGAAPSHPRRSPISCSASENGSSNGKDAALRPTAAETARTIVDLAAHGTLSTIGEDGIPLGTYASYVLDVTGQPILRLRSDAVHTLNLQRNARCSLFIQPADHPARLLARVTLIGEVEAVTPEVAENAAELHATLHAGGVGVDAPRPDDRYYRLNVDRGFYVGQLSGDSQAEVIPGDAYRGAEADPLRACANSLAQLMNTERQEDVLRIG
jgi:Pyridoxamine 5'-phosphate oxidase